VKKIVRAWCIVFTIVMMIVPLSGCRFEHYSRDEVVEWAKTAISRDVVVSEEYFTRTSSDEIYLDNVWTAYIKDMPEITFEIISHKYYAMESASYSIESTYWYEYGKYYFEQYKAEHDTNLVPLDTGINVNSFRLLALFGDRQELSDMVQEAFAVEKYMQSMGSADYVDFRFEYDDILAQVDDSDVFEFCDGFEQLESIEETLLTELAFYTADYRLELDMFTPEEREQAIDYFDRRFVITRADGSEVSYSDLTLSRYGYGMSFGTLYEVLLREDFSPSGTPESFSVVGVDGSFYQFSYSFNDMPYENGKNGYYYIKDGEEIAMQYYFYNHFRSGLFEEISGMKFSEIR